MPTAPCLSPPPGILLSSAFWERHPGHTEGPRRVSLPVTHLSPASALAWTLACCHPLSSCLRHHVLALSLQARVRQPLPPQHCSPAAGPQPWEEPSFSRETSACTSSFPMASAFLEASRWRHSLEGW